MKRTICFMLLLALIAGVFCGCGGASSGNGSDVSSVPSEQTGEPTSKTATLEIKVKSAAIERFKSDRAYDPNKEDITLILVTGQSNFTTGVGYATELGFYNQNPTTAPKPDLPTVPENAQSVYTSGSNSSITALTDNNALSNTRTSSGVTPPFGTEWSMLTGTKTVFVQAARGAVGMHEWVPHPADYICGCTGNGEGVLYLNAVENYKASFEALSKDYNIVYTGYIWNQGEHDEVYGVGDATINSAKAYYDAYKSMHDGFMEELDLDFGGISVVRADKVGDSAQNSMSLTIARTAQYQLCNDIDNLYMLSTIGETCDLSMMDQSNAIHYSQATFNTMGAEMARNLYSLLGLGAPAEYGGVKVYSSNGGLLTSFDAGGKLSEGKTELERSDTLGKMLIKLSALGTKHTLSYSLTVGGEDASTLVDSFGNPDWTALYKDHGLNTVNLKVTLE